MARAVYRMKREERLEIVKRKGWNYGYLFPAYLKANQASGRPIRKKDDKGGIIFMDWRFTENMGWISTWVRKNIKIIDDIRGDITNNLKNLWD